MAKRSRRNNGANRKARPNLVQRQVRRFLAPKIKLKFRNPIRSILRLKLGYRRRRSRNDYAQEVDRYPVIEEINPPKKKSGRPPRGGRTRLGVSQGQPPRNMRSELVMRGCIKRPDANTGSGSGKIRFAKWC